MRQLLSRFSVRLYATLALSVTGLLVLSAIALQSERQSLRDERTSMLSALTEVASHLVDANQALVDQGKQTLEQAKAHVLTELSAMRYNKTEYFFVLDPKGIILANPVQKFVGTDSMKLQDATGFHWNAEAVPRAIRDGVATVEYPWTRAGSSEPVQKFAFYHYEPKWQWVIATGMFLDDLDAILWQRARWLGLATLVIAALLALACMALIRTTVRPIRADRVRQRGGICGVVEVVTDHAAMVAIVVGTASMVGGMSSAIASVCM